MGYVTDIMSLSKSPRGKDSQLRYQVGKPREREIRLSSKLRHAVAAMLAAD